MRKKLLIAAGLLLILAVCRKWDNPFDPTGNHPPKAPTYYTPDSGAVGRDTSIGLAWTSSDPDSGDTVRYDVYFGVSDTMVRVDSGRLDTTWKPASLRFLTRYSWKVVARDNHGDTAAGSVWSFTTVRENHAPDEPHAPQPNSGAFDLMPGQTLLWRSGDPDSGDTVVFDVYFGAGDTLSRVVQNSRDTSYVLPRLSYATTYAWQVVARDPHGAEVEGDTWTFSTVARIVVTAPDSGARRRMGQQDTIRWTGGPSSPSPRRLRPGPIGSSGKARPLAVDSTTIYYSTNNGNNWNRVGIAPSQGVYYWRVPGPSPASSARVQVRKYVAGDTATASSAPFSIYDSLTPTAITVTSPTTASRWEVGSTQNITWTGGTDGFDSLVIYYSPDSGATWIRQAKTLRSGSYAWTVGSPASTRAKVEVRSYCGAHPVTRGQSPKFVTTEAGYPDSVVATIGAGDHPLALCLDSLDNRLYVVNANDAGTVTVVACSTNQVLRVIPVGAMPVAAVWNATNNRVYVANQNSNTVTVIDGSTGDVLTTIPVGVGPSALAWHPDRNKIYVANRTDSTVSVISGSTNQVVATIHVRGGPSALAVRPDNGRVYVANSVSNNVSIIDAAVDSVRSTVNVGANPVAIVSDWEHKAMYVASQTGNTVTIFDSLNATRTVGVPLQPLALALNPQTDKIYAACYMADSVAIINTNTRVLLTKVRVASQPRDILWATFTNKVYVANYGGNSVTLIDGGTNSVVRMVRVGTHPTALLWNGRSRYIYAANYDGSSVSVLGIQ